MLINAKVIETIIRSTHVFDSINIIFKLRVVKVFPKSNITIV